MKLEVGKYYRTREGEKVGPMRGHADGGWYAANDKCERGWYDNGARFYGSRDSTIIAEWTDEPAAPKPSATGPVRTVTRKEIVPGVYGDVSVSWGRGSDEIALCLVKHGEKADYVGHCFLTATDIRAAIATLTEIAEALEYAACGGELAG